MKKFSYVEAIKAQFPQKEDAVVYVEYDCELKKEIGEKEIEEFNSMISQNRELPNELISIFGNVLNSEIMDFSELCDFMTVNNEIDQDTLTETTVNFLDMFSFSDRKEYNSGEINAMIRSSYNFGFKEHERINKMVDSVASNKAVMVAFAYTIADANDKCENKVLVK